MESHYFFHPTLADLSYQDPLTKFVPNMKNLAFQILEETALLTQDSLQTAMRKK